MSSHDANEDADTDRSDDHDRQATESPQNQDERAGGHAEPQTSDHQIRPDRWRGRQQQGLASHRQGVRGSRGQYLHQSNHDASSQVATQPRQSRAGGPQQQGTTRKSGSEVLPQQNQSSGERRQPTQRRRFQPPRQPRQHQQRQQPHTHRGKSQPQSPPVRSHPQQPRLQTVGQQPVLTRQAPSRRQPPQHYPLTQQQQLPRGQSPVQHQQLPRGQPPGQPQFEYWRPSPPVLGIQPPTSQ